MIAAVAMALALAAAAAVAWLWLPAGGESGATRPLRATVPLPALAPVPRMPAPAPAPASVPASAAAPTAPSAVAPSAGRPRPPTPAKARPPLPARPVGRGFARFRTEPAYAEVWIAGTRRCNTPCTLDLAAGSYQVRLVNPTLKREALRTLVVRPEHTRERPAEVSVPGFR